MNRRVLRRRLFAGLCLLLVSWQAGCAAFHPLYGVPARYVPTEMKTGDRSGRKMIDLALLRQPWSIHKIDSGDVLGIYIEGVVGRREDPPPVHFPQNNDAAPSFGLPFPVRDDGTISLPIIGSITLRGLTVREAEEKIIRSYLEPAEYLKRDSYRVQVTLQRPRQYRVLVIRQDSRNEPTGNAFLGQINVGTVKRGTGRVINLPANENDILNALTLTDGLPGLDAENAVYIIRRHGNKRAARDPGSSNLDFNPTIRPRQQVQQSGFLFRGQSPDGDSGARNGNWRQPDQSDRYGDTNGSQSYLKSAFASQSLSRDFDNRRYGSRLGQSQNQNAGLQQGHSDQYALRRANVENSGSQRLINSSANQGGVVQAYRDGERSNQDLQKAGFLSNRTFYGDSASGDQSNGAQYGYPNQAAPNTRSPQYSMPTQGSPYPMSGPIQMASQYQMSPQTPAQMMPPYSMPGQQPMQFVAQNQNPIQPANPNGNGPLVTVPQLNGPMIPLNENGLMDPSQPGFIPQQPNYPNPSEVGSQPQYYPGPNGQMLGGPNTQYPQSGGFAPGMQPMPNWMPGPNQMGPTPINPAGDPNDPSQRHSFDANSMEGRHVIRIPIRLAPGETADVRPEDVVLYDGDIVFIEGRDAEVFFTGGLLGGGQFTLPRDYDLDIMQAISLSQSRQTGIIGNARGGISALNSDVAVSPSTAIVMRKLPDGSEIPIKVDLYRARTDQSERLYIKPGDFIFVQYTPLEAIAAFFERHLLESAIFGLVTQNIASGNTTTH